MKHTPELIVMLTHNDVTVPDAAAVFARCQHTRARYWGFKEEGLPYITDRGVLYARYYDALVEKILQHFPLADMGFTPEECRSAAIAMAVALPAREIDEKCESLYGQDCREGS